MEGYVSSGAIIRGSYRYLLWREWRGCAPDENWNWWEGDDGEPVLDGSGARIGEPRSCLFIMLNPSTADGERDDPTIRRCVSYAKRWGYDRLEVVNLFAYRATKPSVILGMTGTGDPIGPENQEFIEDRSRRAGLVVCAWGISGSHIGQAETVLGWIDPAIKTHALRLTRNGNPCHPLYLPRDLQPFEWRPK